MAASASVCDLQFAISRVINMPQSVINTAIGIEAEMHHPALNGTKHAFRHCTVTYRDPPNCGPG